MSPRAPADSTSTRGTLKHAPHLHGATSVTEPSSASSMSQSSAASCVLARSAVERSCSSSASYFRRDSSSRRRSHASCTASNLARAWSPCAARKLHSDQHRHTRPSSATPSARAGFLALPCLAPGPNVNTHHRCSQGDTRRDCRSLLCPGGARVPGLGMRPSVAPRSPSGRRPVGRRGTGRCSHWAHLRPPPLSEVGGGLAGASSARARQRKGACRAARGLPTPRRRDSGRPPARPRERRERNGECGQRRRG